jgi:predicted RecB family nuclease
MSERLKAEIAKDRPALEVSGVTAATDAKLREMGIRTVGELSAAKTRTLKAGGVKSATAKKIVANAKKQLK